MASEEDDIPMGDTGGAAAGGGGAAAASSRAGPYGLRAAPKPAHFNAGFLYGANYDRALDKAEQDAAIDLLMRQMDALVKSGGARRHGTRQRGGADSLFVQACTRVLLNIRAGAVGAAGGVNAAAAAAIDTTLGDRASALRSAGMIAAGYTVIYGVPEVPFLTSALWSAAAYAPSMIQNWAANIIGAALSAAEISALGVTGVSMVMLFTIGVLSVYFMNQLPGMAIASAGRTSMETIKSFYTWGKSVIGREPAPGEVAHVAAAAVVAPAPAAGAAAAAAAAAAPEKYKVGIMVISGPNARALAARMLRIDDTPANKARLNAMRQAGGRRRKSHRKSRKAHRKVHRKSSKSRKSRKSRRQH